MSRAVARDLRRRYGERHRIVRAESGAAALDALRQIRLRGDLVAVILADYRMAEMNEIEDSTTRVSTLVGAAKQYSQLDRAPYQVVDVHELLESTLLMLSGKFPPGITVVKDYQAGLPHIPAYASELNQVWTNLIDNAVSAMGGQCGHIGCCDTSPMQHASAHAAQSGHPFIRSFEPGEDWFYSHQDKEMYDGPALAPPQHHPLDQPTPGPAGRVPSDWRFHVH